MKIDVYISNVSEDIWELITSLPLQVRKYEIDENAFLSDRDIFCLDPHKRSIVIVPIQLDPDFLQYYQKLLKNNSVEVWVPTRHTGEICYDLQADTVLWNKLISLSQTETLVLKSYSASREFYAILAALRQGGGKIETPESPEPQHAWTVDFFGSKGGIRQLTQELGCEAKQKQNWMSPGYISPNNIVTALMAADYYLKNNGVVIKTNKAHSGVGVVIVHPDQLPHTINDCTAYFQKLFSQEKYWQRFPSIVEEYLSADTKVGGGNPNAEFLIEPNGTVKFLYSCGLRVTPQGVFKGIEISEKLFPKSVLQRMLDFGKGIGGALSKAGYRGYFDIDCIYTKSGKVFLTESNVRRTGGSHVYHAVQRLCGAEFQKTFFILSNNIYALPANTVCTFEKIQTTLQSVLFSPKTKTGVILVAANILKQHKISYIVVGKDKASAIAIEAKMEELLNSE